MITALQQARHHRGWSQARLMRELRLVAACHGLTLPAPDSLRTQLSRWENGHVTPQFYQPLLCEVYQTSPVALGFGPPLPAGEVWGAQQAAALTQALDAALVESSTEVINHLAHRWLVSPSPAVLELSAGPRVGHAQVEQTQAAVIRLRRLDDHLPAPLTHALVRRQLRQTAHLLDHGTCPDRLGQQLLRAVGELCQLAAWVAADAGWHTQASGYVEQGLRAAHAAGEVELTGNIISTYSYQLTNTGQPRQAAVLARTAYAGAARTASATTRALLLERVAWADARSGDLSGCLQALGQVQQAYDHSCPSEDPDWVYWFNQQEIDVMAGRCHTELGQARTAITVLEDALAAYDCSRVRETCLYRTWLARDYLQVAEIAQAATLASQVCTDAGPTGSARVQERLDDLALQLAPHARVAEVADFLTLHHAHTTP